MSLKTLNPYLLLIFFLFLSACATKPSMVPVEDKSRQQEHRNESTQVDTIESSQSDDSRREDSAPVVVEDQLQDSQPVVLALLKQAEEETANGNSQQAIATLERGIRIQPKDPWLWHQLGVLRLKQKQWQKAIVMAEKSLSLAQGHQNLISANWQIIATARRGMGDERGAIEAESMIEQVRG